MAEGYGVDGIAHEVMQQPGVQSDRKSGDIGYADGVSCGRKSGDIGYEDGVSCGRKSGDIGYADGVSCGRKSGDIGYADGILCGRKSGDIGYEDGVSCDSKSGERAGAQATSTSTQPERLDSFLAQASGMSRSAAQRLCAGGRVTINGTVADKNDRVCPGDSVIWDIPAPIPMAAEPEDIPLDIVYEDDEMLVVNKPQGMVVHPAAGNYTNTLVNALLYHCEGSLSGINGVIRPGIVHRIDKDTSGLLLVAKTDRAHLSLAAQIKAHSLGRIYWAVILGGMREEEGIIDAPIARNPRDRKKMTVSHAPGARDAITNWRVLERFSGYTLMEFRLQTGRTHQIRVHMASIGHPILGDTVYGHGNDPFEKKHRAILLGQCLHAKTIGFMHPATGERMAFTSPLPPEFEEVLRILRNTTGGTTS